MIEKFDQSFHVANRLCVQQKPHTDCEHNHMEIVVPDFLHLSDTAGLVLDVVVNASKRQTSRLSERKYLMIRLAGCREQTSASDQILTEDFVASRACPSIKTHSAPVKNGGFCEFFPNVCCVFFSLSKWVSTKSQSSVKDAKYVFQNFCAIFVCTRVPTNFKIYAQLYSLKP